MGKTQRTMQSKVVGENDTTTVPVVSLVELLTGQKCLVVIAVDKEGLIHSYGDAAPLMVAMALEAMSSMAALELGPERALDIATGATVGRPTDDR